MLKVDGMLVVLMLFIPLLMTSCQALTPEQQARVDMIGIELGKIRSDISVLIPEGVHLTGLIRDVTRRIKSKEIPKEEGMKVIAFYKGKRTLVQETIKNLGLRAKVIEGERRKLEAEGISTWRLVGELALGAAFTFFGINRQVKLGKTRKAFGVVSRAADNSGENGEAPAGLRTEIRNEATLAGVAKGLLKDLHKEASEGRI